MISIILPTLGNRILETKRLIDSLNKQIYKGFEVIVVSQDNHENVDNLFRNVSFKYKHIRINEKGLSNARNVGLHYVNGDILTFSDDDCWYPEYAFEFIKNIFDNKKYDILSLQVFDPINNYYYKRYNFFSEDQLTKFNILKKSSIEIFINLKKVKKEDIKFDIRFGLGAKYNSGEENILLMDLIKKGYNIAYYPKIIVYHKKRASERKLTLDTFIGKGALFKRLFSDMSGFILLIIFLIKKIKRMDDPINCIYRSIKEYFQS